jgi:hypothetical protein
LINKYFRLLGEIDSLPNVDVVGRIWSDAGKFLNNSDGFVKGQYGQLDFMDALLREGRSIDGLNPAIVLEEGFDTLPGLSKSTQRFADIVSGSNKYEVKNFAHYDDLPNGVKNLSNAVASFEGYLGEIALQANGTADDVIALLKQRHMVFQGSPQGSEAMLEKMEEAGEKILNSINWVDEIEKETVLRYFKQQMQSAPTNVLNTPGESLIIFRGKRVPFS